MISKGVIPCTHVAQSRRGVFYIVERGYPFRAYRLVFCCIIHFQKSLGKAILVIILAISERGRKFYSKNFLGTGKSGTIARPPYIAPPFFFTRPPFFRDKTRFLIQSDCGQLGFTLSDSERHAGAMKQPSKQAADRVCSRPNDDANC